MVMYRYRQISHLIKLVLVQHYHLSILPSVSYYDDYLYYKHIAIKTGQTVVNKDSAAIWTLSANDILDDDIVS